MEDILKTKKKKGSVTNKIRDGEQKAAPTMLQIPLIFSLFYPLVHSITSYQQLKRVKSDLSKKHDLFIEKRRHTRKLAFTHPFLSAYCSTHIKSSIIIIIWKGSICNKKPRHHMETLNHAKEERNTNKKTNNPLLCLSALNLKAL